MSKQIIKHSFKAGLSSVDKLNQIMQSINHIIRKPEEEDMSEYFLDEDKIGSFSDLEIIEKDFTVVITIK